MHDLGEAEVLAVERDRRVNVVNDVTDADTGHGTSVPAGCLAARRRSAAAAPAVAGPVRRAAPARLAAAAIPGTFGQQHGTDARNGLRPGLGEQRGRRLLAVLAGAGHPGGDQPGHDRRRERRAAPLGHAVELPLLVRCTASTWQM